METSPRRIEASPFRTKRRQSELSKMRNLKMARSAHAYVRGSTVKFYEWLESASWLWSSVVGHVTEPLCEERV
jgi:uncharacterized protein (DUF2252 family)